MVLLFGLLSEAIIPTLALDGLADRPGWIAYEFIRASVHKVRGMAGVVLVDRWFGQYFFLDHYVRITKRFQGQAAQNAR